MNLSSASAAQDDATPPACDGAPARGRPRNEAVERAVVEGVLKLLEEGASFGDLSMERIARTVGVGKATLYRRWHDKEDLFVDVVRATEPPDPELPGTSVRDDLVVLVESLRRRGVARQSSAMLLNVHAQMKAGPRLWREYQDRMVRPRRRLVVEVLSRGRRTGEIRADVDLQLAHDLIVGPMLLRTVLTCEPDLPEGLSEEIVDTVLEALRPHPPE